MPHRGFVPLPADFAERLFNAARFSPRAALESDDTRKQLIPYVVLRFQDQLFAYSRGMQSSEKRLVEQWSIGLGGHIELRDNSLFSDAAALYRDAARREVFEEVSLDTTYDEHVVGLLNDDSNDVGRVHLGIVHAWNLGEPHVRRAERKIRSSSFVRIGEVGRRRQEFETWSQVLIDAILGGAFPPWKPIERLSP